MRLLLEPKPVSLTSSTEIIDQLQVVNVCHRNSTIFLPSFSLSPSLFTWGKQLAHLSLFYHKTWDEAMERAAILSTMMAAPSSFSLSMPCLSSSFSQDAPQEQSDKRYGGNMRGGTSKSIEDPYIRHVSAMRRTVIDVVKGKRRRSSSKSSPKRSVSFSSSAWNSGKPLSREMWLTKVPHLVWGTASTLPTSTQLEPLPDDLCIAPLQAKLVWVIRRTMEHYFLKTFPLISSAKQSEETSFLASAAPENSSSPALSARFPLPLPYYLLINYGEQPLFVNAWKVQRGCSCILQQGDWISFLESALDRYIGVAEPGMAPPHTFSISPQQTMLLTKESQHLERSEDENKPCDVQRKKKNSASKALEKEMVSDTISASKKFMELSESQGNSVVPSMLQTPRKKALQPNRKNQWSFSLEGPTMTREDFCKSVVRTLLAALDEVVKEYEKDDEGSNSSPWWLHIDEEDFFHRVWCCHTRIAHSPGRQVLFPSHRGDQLFPAEGAKAFGWCVPHLSASVLRWLYRFHDEQRKGETGQGNRHWWWWKEYRKGGQKDPSWKERTDSDGPAHINEEPVARPSFLQKGENIYPSISLCDVICVPGDHTKLSGRGSTDTSSDEEEDMMFTVRAPSPLLERWRVSYFPSNVSALHSEKMACSASSSLSLSVVSPLECLEINKLVLRAEVHEEDTIQAHHSDRVQTGKEEGEKKKENLKSTFLCPKEESVDVEEEVHAGMCVPVPLNFDGNTSCASNCTDRIDSVPQSYIFQTRVESDGKSKIREQWWGDHSHNMVASPSSSSSSVAQATAMLHLIPAPLPVYRFVRDISRDADSKVICSVAPSSGHSIHRNHPQDDKRSRIYYYYFSEDEKENSSERQSKNGKDPKRRCLLENGEPLWNDFSDPEKRRRNNKKRRVL